MGSQVDCLMDESPLEVTKAMRACIVEAGTSMIFSASCAAVYAQQAPAQDGVGDQGTWCCVW